MKQLLIPTVIVTGLLLLILFLSYAATIWTVWELLHCNSTPPTSLCILQGHSKEFCAEVERELYGN
jgi:hypothetical protein